MKISIISITYFKTIELIYKETQSQMQVAVGREMEAATGAALAESPLSISTRWMRSSIAAMRALICSRDLRQRSAPAGQLSAARTR